MNQEPLSSPITFECPGCGAMFQSHVKITMPPGWNFQYGAGSNQWLICGDCDDARRDALEPLDIKMPGANRAGATL